MDYVSLDIVSPEERAEVLIAFLADFPFESFETGGGVLRAYMPAERLEACRCGVDALLEEQGVAGRYAVIRDENWNALWESDFPRVDVDGRAVIRAPFHEPAPEGVLEVVVTPRMSFGTGNHATTQLMVRALLDLKVAGRRGLDLGCGTGVLAIVAAKCGAAHVDAVDIDDRCCASCRDNAAANGVAERIETLRGDVACVAGRHYDFILANINRNMLLAALPACAELLAPGGDLLLSGFFEQDVPMLVEAARACGFGHTATEARAEWRMIRFIKERS